MSYNFNMKHEARAQKFPMKVTAGPSVYISSASVGEAAESASGCERDFHLRGRAAGGYVDHTRLLPLLTTPVFGHREKIAHPVKAPSAAECLRVCEIDRRVFAQASRTRSWALPSSPKPKSR